MRKTRRALSLVIAAMMIISMLVVGTVAASAAGSYTVNGTAYTSLSTAMQKGNYITLNADSTENYVYCNMNTKKSVTIDLNGNTLSFPAPTSGRNTYFTTSTYGTSITFINGTVDFQYSAALDDTACINVGKDGSAIIGEGATIKAHGTNALIFVGSDSNIVVDGGSLQAEDSFAIVANGSQVSNGSHNYTINVKSGSVSTNGDSPAIYHCNDGTLNISGGSITGRPAVYVKSGDTTITGGTLNGVGADTDYEYYGGGANPTGDDLVVDNCGYPGGEPNVTVTGGTFNSENGEAVAAYSSQGEDPIEDFVAGGTFTSANGEAVASYAEDAYVPVNNFISGGTFSGDVSEYAKNGSYMKYNAATDTTSYSYYSNNPNKLQSKKYVIDAYQNKVDKTGESTGDEGNDINTKGVRIITKFTNDINASEYGYIVGKYSGNKTVDQMDFSRLNTNNGAKKIDCTGSENNIDGLGAGYVTLAVNGMEAGDKVVARFYAVINGVTYYSNYVSAFGNVNGGILAEMI